MGVDPLVTELVMVGVEKGLTVADLDPVPDTVAKGLRDPDVESVVDGVLEEVAPGVPKAVGDCVTVPDPDSDPVRVLEGLRGAVGVLVTLVVCVKEGVKVLVVL